MKPLLPRLIVLFVHLFLGVECFRKAPPPRSCCSIPRGGGGGEDDESSSIFSSIVRQSSKALAATARGSTKMAADLVRPKDVDWKELVGWWHLDVAMESGAASDSGGLTVQITPNGRARFTDANGQDHDVPVEFRPASWPRSAKLKFEIKPQGLLYECTIQRKLANLEIIKLRGKIHTVRRFQGKVQVGTFVGRRRVVIMEEEEEEYEDESEEAESHEGEAALSENDEPDEEKPFYGSSGASDDSEGFDDESEEEEE